MTFEQREERFAPHIVAGTVLQAVGFDRNYKQMDRVIFAFCDEETLIDRLQFVYKTRYHTVEIQLVRNGEYVTVAALTRKEFTMKNAWQNARRILEANS